MHQDHPVSTYPILARAALREQSTHERFRRPLARRVRRGHGDTLSVRGSFAARMHDVSRAVRELALQVIGQAGR